MTLTTKPTKEEVRRVMEQHRKDRAAPTPDEYRRQLGWFLMPELTNKSAECAR